MIDSGLGQNKAQMRPPGRFFVIEVEPMRRDHPSRNLLALVPQDEVAIEMDASS
jgi:hypothetical protein